MKAHELAKLLLEMPDVEVAITYSYGDGEGGQTTEFTPELIKYNKYYQIEFVAN